MISVGVDCHVSATKPRNLEMAVQLYGLMQPSSLKRLNSIVALLPALLSGVHSKQRMRSTANMLCGQRRQRERR